MLSKLILKKYFDDSNDVLLVFFWVQIKLLG